jgi:hypothetical protein
MAISYYYACILFSLLHIIIITTLLLYIQFLSAISAIIIIILLLTLLFSHYAIIITLCHYITVAINITLLLRHYYAYYKAIIIIHIITQRTRDITTPRRWQQHCHYWLFLIIFIDSFSRHIDTYTSLHIIDITTLILIWHIHFTLRITLTLLHYYAIDLRHYIITLQHMALRHITHTVHEENMW